MKSVLKRITRSSAFPAFVLMVAVYVANTFLVKGFTGGAALLSFINLAAPLVCLTIALSVVVIGGGFDVSLGAIVCVVNVTYVTFVDKGVPVFTAALAGIGLATAVGLLNGVMVGFFRLNPLLTTFATTSVASGLALCIMPTPSGVGNADFIRFYSSGNILGIPTSVWFILVPLIIWFLISFFQDLPEEVEESAKVDGATEWQLFCRIVLPLVAPGIAAVAMLSFMYAWNEYTYTVIFTRSPANNTVPLALSVLNTEDNLTNFGLVAAGGVMSVIPITLFVIFAQNYLISGLSSGAVKE